MAIFDAELRRVQGGFSEDDDDAKLLPVRVFFTADDPAVVVARARDVLAQVIQRMDSWPADDGWPDLLPQWFVERCAPEPAADGAGDSAGSLARWRAMSPEEKAADAKRPWTLSSWLYYFDPVEGMGEDRSWWWWNAGGDEPGTGWIDVVTTGWPFGTGSLYWLIQGCGGTDPHY
jgi:hypothetical protein